MVGGLLAAACGSDAAGDPPSVAELPDRIAEAQDTGDPMIVLGCAPDRWRDDVWDAEGEFDRATAAGAAAVALADDVWDGSDLPAGAREALFDRTFRIGRSLLLPVLVDGEVRVLLRYDAQGPDVWSIGGASTCTGRP